ncbi:FAD-dependent oxidoreductase [Lacihabitans sp. LS3-19]|uniref:FAD-dependent oxidoreductase n=1 Tax=Lacihabitans sp. LS3-19 TaxID=2487335 RepID=UPI0020CFD79D|nr:FAD-dependent oxidoreductase [Lacihabitans sp. LS3-19]MCP9770451.1 FAD-dependent oxidoreductase [Lacihabitans sp. LS3-19]
MNLKIGFYLFISLLPCFGFSQKTFEADVVIYGGTSAGIAAAVEVVRSGYTVLVVSPDTHLGGLSSNGLGYTDTGDKTVIGGIAKEFYKELYQHYNKPEAWIWQKKEEYGNRGQNTVAMDESSMWIFEPHVAEGIFENWVKENKIKILRNEYLLREKGGLIKKNNSISQFKTLSGKTIKGKYFIDASYEGDLMAAAGVTYHVGREANSVYDEKFNGVQKDVRHHGHYFKTPISPYNIAGNAQSGLLPEISKIPPGENGEGDQRLQAYCYRLCMSFHPENRVAFPKPANYDPKRYELLKRVLDSGWNEVFDKFDVIPNKKTDTNNHGPFSSDYIGKNYAYPEADYATRRSILEEHENYQKGYLYFLQNDPSVPKNIHDEMQKWGLAKDEFAENNNWPYQIYVREARRMIGEYVMNENHTLGKIEIKRPIGMGSYSLDSHNAQRYVTEDGFVQNEGDIGVHPPKPYSIDYGALLPKEKECNNLLVPVCVSSSHTAFGSIRMEPVFMILGQSAAAAAVLSIKHKTSPQKLDFELLRTKLLKEKQVLIAK